MWQISLSNTLCPPHPPIFLFLFFQIVKIFHKFLSVCLFLFDCFLGLHLQHMEVPRPGVEVELQLPACATASATWDPRCICNLRHSSCQGWILNPLSEARDQTWILMGTSLVHNLLSHNGNSQTFSLSLCCYGDLQSVIFAITIAKRL